MDFYTPEQDKQKNQVEVAVENALPSVLLIGDSISQGYTPVVRELASAAAECIDGKKVPRISIA